MDQHSFLQTNSRLDCSDLSDDDLNIHENMMEGVEVIIHASGNIPTPSSPIVPGPRETPTNEPWTTSMAIIATTSPEIKALNLPTTPSFPEPITCSKSLCLSSLPAAQTSSQERVPGPFISKPELRIRCQSEYLPRKSSLLYEDRDPEATQEGTRPNSKNLLTIDTSFVETEGNQHLRRGRHRRASYASLPSPAEISPTTTGSNRGIREAKWKSFTYNSPLAVDDFPFPLSPPPVPPISSLPQTIAAAYTQHTGDPVPSKRMKLKEGPTMRAGLR